MLTRKFWMQWRSNALRGPGSTVTWGPSLSLPSTSPSSPFPPPFPPLPQPSPPPAVKRAPNPASGSGERCKLSPAGSGAEPQPKSNLVHFSLKIRHLVATILMICLTFFSVTPLLGAPGARGPRFIEPPEPLVPTPVFGWI